MAAEKKEFKRYFPVMNKCYCCCCMEFETAIKLCSIIFAVFSFLGFISTRGYGRSMYYRSLVELVASILLIIGIFKKKDNFIRPFLFLSIIEVVCLFGLLIIVSIYFFINKDSFVDAFLESAENDPNLIYYYNNEEAASTIINYVYILFVILIFICNSIYIYFFLCVGSYMDTLREEKFRIEEARKLESDETNLNYTNQV